MMLCQPITTALSFTLPLQLTQAKVYKYSLEIKSYPYSKMKLSTSNDKDETLTPSEPETPDNITSQASPPGLSSAELMRAMGTSPRRILLSFASATSIALAANFLGVTSRILQVLPEETVESTGLDTYYPIGDYKRYRGQGYTGLIPKEWVADTTVELAKAQRRAKALDYTAKKSTSSGILPDAAFGPPGRLDARGISKGDTNVSILVSKVPPGFSLQGSLGSPKEAAEILLKVSLAPEGSGRVATLLNAKEDSGRYQFQYDVDRGDRGPPLRAISIIAERNGNTLYTLTVVAPQEEWNPVNAAKLQKIASSFHLT